MHGVLQGHPVPGLPGAVRRRRGDARRRQPAAQAARRLAGVGQAARRARAWPTSWSRRTASSAARSPRTSASEEKAGLAAHVGAQPGDCVFFAAGPVKTSRALLGAARLEIGRRCGLIDEYAWSFLWVVDAPLFEPAGRRDRLRRRRGRLAAPGPRCTTPSPRPAEDLDTFDTDPGNALAYAYDIVCNGNEIGGGSIRIHREDVQKRVFAVMGIGEAEAAGEVRLPARGVQVRRRRRTAASPSAGTGSAPCSPAPTRSAT